jgi:hypothetical protein
MQSPLLVRTIAVLFMAFGTQAVLAQTTETGQSASTSSEVSSDASNTSNQTASSDQSQTTYVPSLDGSGLIAINDMFRTRMLVGANSSGGWDSNPDNLEQGAASGAFIFSPYIGVQVNSARVQYLFQYQPTIRHYTSDQYGGGVLNLGSATITGKLSERWQWDFKAIGSHGQDSIRLLAPGQTIPVGNIAGASGGTSSYFPNAGVVTYLSGEAGIHHDLSQRDIIEFTAANSYSDYTGLHQKSSIATVTARYQRAVSQKLSLLVYDQNSYYYGAIHCGSFGFGGGVNWKMRENTSLSLMGGPQLDAADCGKQQGFSYAASFGSRFTSKSQIYATSSREMTTTYLGPGLWQETVSGGYQRELTPSRVVGFDIGYVTSDALTATSSYKGTYFGGIYSHRIGHALAFSVSYRNYTGNWGETNFTRRVALVSFSWTPGVGHLFQ